jgi:hypothetical protein
MSIVSAHRSLVLTGHRTLQRFCRDVVSCQSADSAAHEEDENEAVPDAAETEREAEHGRALFVGPRTESRSATPFVSLPRR